MLLNLSLLKRRVALVAKDTVPTVRFIGQSRSGQILVIETPNYAEPPGRLVLRNADSLALEGIMEGINAPAALSPSGRTLLAAGPLLAGEQDSAVLVDLEKQTVTERFPLTMPFVWIDETRFVAQRHLRPGGASETVVVDLGTGMTQAVLDGVPLDPEKSVVLSPRRDVLYTATGYSRISAVRLSDTALLWQRLPVRVVSQGMTYALCMDAVRSRIVAVGLGDHDLLEMDAESGRELGRQDLGSWMEPLGLPKHHGLACAAVRDDGLLALGTDKGVLALCWPDGRWEVQKVAGRAVEALTFASGGAHLLLGGAERCLRLVNIPL